MFIKMIRTQTGDCGTLHAGVIYDASKDAKLKKEAGGYVQAGFAEELTKAEVEAMTADANEPKPAKGKKKAATAPAPASPAATAPAAPAATATDGIDPK